MSHETEFDGRPDLIKRRAQSIILQRVMMSVAVFFVIACLTILVFNAFQSLATRDTLVDCTTPSGECYQEGQERTAGIVADIVDLARLASVAAAYCADQPGVQTFNDIKDCTEEVLGVEKEK